MSEHQVRRSITARQLMERYSCSRKTIYNWRENAGFPKPFAFGRYFLDEVEAWESSRGE